MDENKYLVKIIDSLPRDLDCGDVSRIARYCEGYKGKINVRGGRKGEIYDCKFPSGILEVGKKESRLELAIEKIEGQNSENYLRELYNLFMYGEISPPENCG